MRKITAFLNELSDEHERRSRRMLAAALALALLGIAAGLRPPEVVTKTVTETKTIIEYQYRTQYVYGGESHRPAAAPPLAFPAGRELPKPFENVDPLTKHLCITPRWVNFTSIGDQKVTVSNPSPGEIGITRIKFFSDRATSGFVVDSRDCLDRVLREGEPCTIRITLKRRIGETMTLLIAHDAGSEPELMTAMALE
ncbi:MAG TPA: hypothetical protein VII75_13030 [Thermoanaerobaculia bacterium]|nr:hypothetical protein [Thermoanaerobaculia bacterium]